VSRILFYAINGIGLGHVARLSVVANAIGRAHPDLELCYHSNSPAADSFFDCSGTIVQQKKASAALQYLLTGQAFERAVAKHAPDLIVCDTHWPEKLNVMSRSVRRALVLRMPDAGYAAKVLAFATATFDAIVVPHSQAAIDEWLVPDPAACPFMDHPAVQVVGPLARVVVREKSPALDRRVLFLLGGGGEYHGAPSVESLVARLHNVATRLRRSGIRSQIVQGPFMKFEVPPGPWDILRTYDVPEYIDERTIVVARPSYNSCQEAIGAGARLVIVGEHDGYHEDAVGRAKWLEASGLAVRAHEDVTAAILGEFERGWDPVAIRARGAVNAGLTTAVDRIVGLVKESSCLAG
jgi:UDP-N-acetylglucosamine--N-acetylmuramyl-(pentapeptide) pyrophosphoryl-undecaprenol N-acetylglucosamine transferase